MAHIRCLPEGVHFSPEGIIERWLEAFASAIPPKKLDAQVNQRGDYLWNVFFCDEISYLFDASARTAYDETDCPQVLFFETHGREKDGYIVHELILTDKAQLSAAVLCDFPDAFIVSPDFSWTYVHSHEGDDFFCRRQF